MKQNKIIKWLYGLFMLLPMLCVGVKCLYVTFNKNAKDSYSNSSLVEQTSLITSTGNLEDNKQYDLYISLNDTAPSTIQYFNYKEISIDWVADYNAPSGHNYDSVGIYQATTTQYYVYLRENNTIIKTYWDGVGTFGNNWYFSIVANGNIALNGTQPLNIYTNTFKQETLDNAFYYAIDEFNEIGFNKLDFVSWFSVFYNNTNIYTTFANCYINYMLFVTVAFFIPRVLLWFVNFAYSMADAFSKKTDGGGY